MFFFLLQTVSPSSAFILKPIHGMFQTICIFPDAWQTWKRDERPFGFFLFAEVLNKIHMKTKVKSKLV